MKSTKKIQFLLNGIAGIMLLLSTHICSAQDIHLKDIIGKYDASIQKTKAGVIYLIRKNGVVETESIGAYNFDTDNAFNIGSNTKTMTAVLILQEVKKGTLSLSDSLGTFLDPIQNVDGSISVEELLRHRSGLGEVAGKYFLDYFMCSADSAYSGNFLNRIPLDSTTQRGAFNYCNTNYILLGHILEKVTDQSYFDLLRERIFKPCDMTRSYPYLHKGIDRLVTPLMQGEDVSQHLNHKFFMKYAFSAGSVSSTLNDMLKFYDHLYVKGTLLPDDLFAKLIDFDSGEYGMGMFTETLNGKEYIGHGGNNIGYTYRNYFDRETGNAILMFGNDYRVSIEPMISEELENYLNDREVSTAFPESTLKSFKHLIGSYELKEIGETLEIKTVDKVPNLIVQGMELELVRLNDESFINLDLGIRIESIQQSADLLFNQNGHELRMVRTNH